MIVVDLRNIKIKNKIIDMDIWELFFRNKKPVLCVDKQKFHCLGLTDFEKNNIYIYSKQSLGELKDTIFHELLHIFFSYGYFSIKHYDEETLIELIIYLNHYANDILNNIGREKK